MTSIKKDMVYAGAFSLLFAGLLLGAGFQRFIVINSLSPIYSRQYVKQVTREAQLLLFIGFIVFVIGVAVLSHAMKTE